MDRKNINNIAVLTAKLQNDFPFVLQWIKRSIEINNGNGSSAYFSRFRHPLKGWSPAYPETTGYLIPTLFDYAEYTNNKEWSDIALKCTDWLCRVQRQSGGFPSNFEDNPKLSVFNTGQILLGLLRSYQETNNPKYEIVIKKAYQWLMTGLEEGIWKNHNYVENYIPAYYTRVVWPMLAVSKEFKLGGEQKLETVLSHFSDWLLPNHSVQNWSFEKDTPAFTHTIAYTIRGFLESSIILNDKKYLEISMLIVNKILDKKLQNCKTAGSFTLNWEADTSFTCNTGNFQLSIICSKIYSITKEEKYKKAAITFLGESATAISTLPFKNMKGAIPGSTPWLGKYMKLKFPNWAGKFYLDAVLQSFSFSAKHVSHKRKKAS